MESWNVWPEVEGRSPKVIADRGVEILLRFPHCSYGDHGYSSCADHHLSCSIYTAPRLKVRRGRPHQHNLGNDTEQDLSSATQHLAFFLRRDRLTHEVPTSAGVCTQPAYNSRSTRRTPHRCTVLPYCILHRNLILVIAVQETLRYIIVVCRFVRVAIIRPFLTYGYSL